MVASNRIAPRSSSRFAKGHTPFPNWLLDTVMPDLKDTEFRLLCLIVRQTQGWHDAKTGGRKTSDWVTRSQMKVKTGRNSAALSRALEVLVRRKLIEVRGNAGQLLLTPKQRREARGHITYALHPQISDEGFMNVKSEHESGEAEETSSLLGGRKTKIEHINALKANRTKETQTKATETKSNGTKSIMPQREKQSAMQEFGEEGLFDINNLPPLPPAMQNLIDAYGYMYDRRFLGSAPPAVFSSALTRLYNLQNDHSETELLHRLELFFRCDFAHIKAQRYSLESFVHNADLLGESASVPKIEGF